MEYRKYQLKKQIIEALEANDNDLYSLLKSQWAHRFGVESLEELKNLDLTPVNPRPKNKDKQNNDGLQDYPLDADEQISLRYDDNKEKEIKNETEYVVESSDVISSDVISKESVEIKSYEISNKEVKENKTLNRVKEYKSSQEVKALIPLPPKPKYSYLRKWLLRS